MSPAHHRGLSDRRWRDCVPHSRKGSHRAGAYDRCGKASAGRFANLRRRRRPLNLVWFWLGVGRSAESVREPLILLANFDQRASLVYSVCVLEARRSLALCSMRDCRRLASAVCERGSRCSMNLSQMFGLACLTLLVGVPAWPLEQPSNETCPHPKGWKLTNEELQRVLSDHEQWAQKLWKGLKTSEGRANLCNADLREVDLNKANLLGAEL